MAKVAADEPTFELHAFADSTYRFEVDFLLRKHGFRIRCRKDDHEPVWERGGEEYRQRDALRMIPNGEIVDARKKEQRYYGQGWR